MNGMEQRKEEEARAERFDKNFEGVDPAIDNFKSLCIKQVRAKRSCLKCRRQFFSTGNANRMCASCIVKINKIVVRPVAYTQGEKERSDWSDY